MSIPRDYVQAAKASRRPITTLLLEALRLRLSHTRLGFSEYIDFQLYRNDLTWAEKAAFGGLRAQAVLQDILIDDYSRFLTLDKLTMYTLLNGHNLPTPKVRATYRSHRPIHTVQIQTSQELANYLGDSTHLPVYVKRSFGAYGRGNILIKDVDGENAILGNGTTEQLVKFCESLDHGNSLGWILQEPLSSHTEIRNLTQSEKISGLRIHTFLSRGVTAVTKVIFKINVGVRDSDNFEHGASGNMLGAVEISTGKVIRAISGTGLNQKENPRHPKTGAEIVGFHIPYWSETLDLANDAAKAFPGFICPGWDIALCEDGPKILEVNAFGDIDLSQHAYRQSFLDKEFLSLMGELGLERLIYLPPRNRKKSLTNHRMGIRRHHWLW
jgi:Sugar-transfer associated ATP-grasp